ncbi:MULTISPECIES: DUF6541 family protein [Microbacterium]|uniref:Uncharacterized protein n=1 Tax=Microbacterium wangchenii TaxID=2541726 RepID=A0ABX5SS22_9MICO|nr:MULTISPECIES: DUF6541 family protein [Microbacterium]MCK6066759.1 hypothetical protein [Microbacterium sp. EYE_512]QBR88077.1 hypothetical protein E4K62_04830 [Microbacterium wangchenii]TXK18133.1 hypothetical protein FVP99_05970 [Microbacterium wangchenii]
MIGDWIAAVPVILVAAAVVFVPGAAVLALLGLRGLRLWGLAPVVGTVSVGGLALAVDLLGLPWTPLVFLVGCVVLVVAAAVAGWVLHLRPSPARAAARRRTALLVAGIAVGGALVVVRLLLYIQTPDGISQTNDAVFHLNAIRFILETQSASSLHVSEVIGGRGFYPAGWHGITSLVVMMTGASIPMAANAVAMVIAGLIWPAGIALLARVATHDDVVAAAAGLLAGALHAFPMLMFQWGVLYPNALSTALLPAALSAVITVPAWVRGREGWPRGWRAGMAAALLVLLCIGAIGVAQPAGLLVFGLLSLTWATFATLGRRRGILPLLAIVAMWGALAAVWYFLSRSTSGAHWDAFRGNAEVLVDLALNTHLRLPPAVLVSVLMAVGLVAACRKARLRWLVVAWMAVSALYVAVASIDNLGVRSVLLGAWYADPYRIVALVPLVVIPLAAIGAATVAGWVASFLSDRRWAEWLTYGVLAAVLVVGIVLRPVQQMPEVVENTFDIESRYAEDETSYLNSSERELLEELPRYVDEDARVLVNPSTGGAFGYMLSGLDVYPRTWSPPRHQAWNVLAGSLRDAADDAAVCDALAQYGYPDYVLDFGPGEQAPGRYLMPGMTGFGTQDGFELVAGTKSATLWRITACAQ